MTQSEAKSKHEREVAESGLSKRDWYWKIYLNSSHWRNLRNQVIASLENPGCQKCGRILPLDIHHMNYRNLYDVELTDLLALCRECHDLAHGRKKKIATPKKKSRSKSPRKKPAKRHNLNFIEMKKLHSRLEKAPITFPFNIKEWIQNYKLTFPASKGRINERAKCRLLNRLSKGNDTHKALAKAVAIWGRKPSKKLPKTPKVHIVTEEMAMEIQSQMNPTATQPK